MLIYIIPILIILFLCFYYNMSVKENFTGRPLAPSRPTTTTRRPTTRRVVAQETLTKIPVTKITSTTRRTTTTRPMLSLKELIDMYWKRRSKFY